MIAEVAGLRRRRRFDWQRLCTRLLAGKVEMTLRCKHCGADVSLTERESAQIAADLDRRFSWAEQAQLGFQAVCGDCWLEDEQAKEGRPGRRVHFVSATV
jgi:hypothetical protein